jgi:hypothetical protein
MTTKPLHVATVGGHPLRFFKTPLNDGRPDMPWVAIDDVGRCVGLSRVHRRIHRAVFHRLSKEIVQTVTTADGHVDIAPHVLMRSAVEALIDTGRAPASARDEYVHASAEALMKVAPQPFPSAEALTAWVNVAANRWRLQPEPISIAELFPFIERHGGRDD